MSRQAAAPVWDPVQYGAFGDHRARPFDELLARVDLTAPAHIADLGCGSGELTARLARRWPDASIEALDASPEMIDAARAHAIPGRLAFTVGDLTRWRPRRPVDLIISNAVLHWIPGHTDLLPRWTADLTPGGRLAFQVPGNHDAPSHALLRELCQAPRWRHRLGGLAPQRPVLDPQGYLDLLTRHGCEVDAWETTYIQVLQGDDPVLEWVKGTTLRPILTALDTGEAHDFLNAYGALLRQAYPPGPYGTAFPFRRVFVIAGRAGP
ncbi:trans-aconitate 2-methyltransferase [Actinomadura sp. NBRC 104412]|uniref:trans-aconitate 2-methyltransferase n=1 Tax=Actinomadura sp. NBRC 104412 TaxID=3032203 RepID=UPI0025533228|nr:trans-aconitate 2-methyltransferase [Actinomadura sp. NBRC 104412]